MSDEQLPSLSPVAGQTSDTRLIERAIKQRWPIGEQLKADIVARLGRVLDSQDASNREVASAAKALLACEAQNQSDQHHAEGDKVSVAHRLEVVEDANWYGNEVLLAAESTAPSSAGLAIAGADEGIGLRPALGKDGAGDVGGA